MSDCAHHPGIPASGHCGRCARALCANCLVDFQGRTLCAACKTFALEQLEQEGGGRAARLFACAQLFDGTMALLALLSAAGQLAFRTFLSAGLSADSPLTDPSPLETAWTHLAIAVVVLLLGAIPIAMIRLKHPAAYSAQLLTLLAGPLLSCVWAGCLGALFWGTAPLLLCFWVRPEVRAYWAEETND